MRTKSLILLLGVFLVAGCSKKEETAGWEELEFKVSLRSERYKPGDTILSGEFEDLVTVSVPVQIKPGPGEAHVVQDGIWLHVAWDDLRLKQRPQQGFIFEGFRSFVENRYSSPYGTSWWDKSLPESGQTMGFSEEWDSHQTAVGIDGSGEDPRIWCRMWRWVRNGDKPAIMLGQKREGESPVAEGGPSSALAVDDASR